MNNNLTEIVFVLDRSGSMCSLEEGTISGFNEVISKQKLEDGDALITTVLFDDEIEILHDGVDIRTIQPLTSKEYWSRGMTAFHDALGTTMIKVGNRLHNTPEEERPSKVLMVIITDGHENASKEYKKDKIKEMVETQKNVYSWEFMFLGANIDTVSVGDQTGFSPQSVSGYTCTLDGVNTMYSSISKGITSYRTTGNVGTEWKDDINSK